MAEKKKEEVTKKKSSSTNSKTSNKQKSNSTKKKSNVTTNKTTTKNKRVETTNNNNTKLSNSKVTSKKKENSTNKVNTKTNQKIETNVSKQKKINTKKKSIPKIEESSISKKKKEENPKKQVKEQVKTFFHKVTTAVTIPFKQISNKIKKSVSEKKDTKKKESTKRKGPLLTKKTKKWFMIVSIMCAIIILLEGIYVVTYRIRIEKNTTYYDSLNALDLDDGEIVAVGSSDFHYSKNYDYTKGYEKAKFIKYDINGKIIFEKMYDKGINTTFNSIITVNDGYVIVGNGVFSEEEQQNEASEAIIIKYDKEGNIVWEKFYQVVTNTRFNKVIKTSDGYVAIGQSIYANMEMGNHTTGGGIIVKYDLEGNEVWHNNHGGMKSGNFNDIIEVDGNFYVVGKDATDSANIIKYNQNGEYQWHKNYSYTDSIGFTGITYLDYALYVVGSKKILPEGTSDEDDRSTTNTDALLVKYDLDGNIQFEKTFGGSNYERYNSILTYSNNLYIVGHTTSTDAGFKIETDGNLMTGMVVRYDKNGNILKKETYGGSDNDNLTDIITDGVSIYISGYSNSKNGNITTSKNNGKDYFGKIIKLDFKFRTLMVK